MNGGFGACNWVATVPEEAGREWLERSEHHALSDRAFAEQLKPLRLAGPLQQGEIALISVVRNEALRLPAFFEHYKKLGVRRFFMIDNNSEDATSDLLLGEPLADVFHTDASYSESGFGVAWQAGLARSCCNGHWTLIADADELFVYDGMDEHDLVALSQWLDRHALDRVFAPMIDVYPEGIIGETGRSVGENVECNSWFDAAGYALQYRRCGWVMSGGPRYRLFDKAVALSHGDWMSKYPFFRMSPGLTVLQPHVLWPPDTAPARPLAALIHLKFLDDFAERSARNAREGEHYKSAEKYRTIEQTLTEQPKLIVACEKSRKYEGPKSLIRHNLLLPVDWAADEAAELPHCSTMGDIAYRTWIGAQRPGTMPDGERLEFEDFARRAFTAHLNIVRCSGHLEPGEIGLICVLRNEAARLPLFFDHYKRLGVNRFFMIDNNSDDGTRDLLLAEPQADIFHAHASFSDGQGGIYWAHAVARRFCEGNWLIRPDADELFVYDRMEHHDLGALAQWLERHGMDRIYAMMVDLYPSTAIGGSSQTIAELIERDGWFDSDGYSLDKWPQGWRLTGGPGFRLFRQDDSHRNLIWKYPFLRMGRDTLIYNHHWLWPNDEVTRAPLGALVHLKLMHDFKERSQRYEREGQHFNKSNGYRVINSKIRDMPEVIAFYEGSKRYRGPRSLIRHGMLMPIDWRGEGQTRFDPQKNLQVQWT